MADKIGEIYVELKAEMSGIRADLKKIQNETSNTAGKMKKDFSSSIKSIGSVAAGFGLGFGLVESFRAVTRTITASIQAAREAAIAQAKVAQAVKTTGGAAGYTTDQLSNMAAELQKITGIDDDKILNDVTLQLLTFTNIAGTSFKRAQAAAIDLSAVLGSDLLSQTIQLGKALEDPVKGITALQRVGITFTQAQKDMIAQLMSQNNLLGAQSLILTEIETKYGGQAKATADAAGGIMQLKAQLGDLMEAIGNKFLPFIKDVVSGLQSIAKWSGIIEDKPLTTEDILGQMISSGASKDQINAVRKQLLGELEKSLQDKAVSLGFEGKVLNLDTIQKLIKTAQEQIAEKTNEINENNRIAAESKLKREKEYRAMLNDENRETIKGLQDAIQMYQSEFIPLLLKGKQIQNDIAGVTPPPASRTLTEEELKAQAKARNDYFESVKFEDKNYYDYRLKLINDQVKIFRAAGITEIQAAKYVADEKKKLAKEQFEYEVSLEKKKLDENYVRARANKVILPGDKTAKDMIPKSLTGVKEGKDKTDIFIDKETLGDYEDAAKKRQAIIDQYASSLANIAGNQFMAFIQGEKNIGQAALETAKQYGIAVLDMIAKTALLKAAQAAINAVLPGVGSFLGFNKSISSPAVTGATKASVSASVGGNTNSLLKQMNGSIQALNVNLMNKNMQPIIVSNVDGLQFVPSTVAPAQNRLNKAGVKLDAIR